MPAFVGFFIAVVIVLCLAIVLLVGRSCLRLIRRVRSARQRRRAAGRADTTTDDGTARADAADPGDATGQAGAAPGPGEADAGTADPVADGPDRTGTGPSGPDPRRGLDAADGDGPVYVCPQLHATWQDRGTCPECDQRGVPMGG